ncbi:putative hexaprenyl pyrophosphate synthase, mitochondrial [Smittium mucronatum]|uniref:Putative hexaprenyl pyrophosphate synthase, mitochondrial n=1 Tax=Smittium mucronatum TaxID=133383 RepID=A0A1R0H451_9FUNG|nr:putative hexaprenyl pyrophosphate synthase, mitochondrial [Smittium mucronatum]
MSNIMKSLTSALGKLLGSLPDPTKTRPLARFALKNLSLAPSMQSEIPSRSSIYPKKTPSIEYMKASPNSSSTSLSKEKNQESIQPNDFDKKKLEDNSSFFYTGHLDLGSQRLLIEWIKEPIIASTIDNTNFRNPKYDGIKSFEYSLSEASELVKNDINKIDPLSLVASELGGITDNISRILETGNPTLSKVARHYFQATGKQIRPLVVLLMSQVVNGLALESHSTSQITSDFAFIDRSVPENLDSDKESMIRDSIIRLALSQSLNKDLYNPTINMNNNVILPTQRRLAEITELIHTASLVHDDIIDGSDTRRGIPTSHQVFGNKMSVLAGDFLLARASVSLARLRNPEVVELLATVIMDLVEGEFKQLKNINSDGSNLQYSDLNAPNEDSFKYYIQKTYLKTSSLFAKSLRASAVLGNASDEYVEMAYIFGRNLGTAFQVHSFNFTFTIKMALVDDLLDFTSSQKQTGKPVGADLNLGIATAPVLYAWQEFPELGVLIKRKFSEINDPQTALLLVQKSQGIAKTRQLIQSYAERAMAALSLFPPSPSRQALLQLTHSLIYRTK